MGGSVEWRATVVRAWSVVLFATVAAGCSCSADSTPPVTSAPVATVPPTTDQRLTERAAAAGLGDVSAVSMPPVTDTGETVNWLRGAGTSAVAMVDASDDLWRDGSSACNAVAGQLETAGTPSQVQAAAAGVPDEATREVLVDLQASIASALRACNDPAGFDPAVSQFAWQWALADRRLHELGVR